jgi:hypothetical protein
MVCLFIRPVAKKGRPSSLRFPRTLYPGIFVQSLERATLPYGGRNPKTAKDRDYKTPIIVSAANAFCSAIARTDR